MGAKERAKERGAEQRLGGVRDAGATLSGCSSALWGGRRGWSSDGHEPALPLGSSGLVP